MVLRIVVGNKGLGFFRHKNAALLSVSKKYCLSFFLVETKVFVIGEAILHRDVPHSIDQKHGRKYGSV